MTCGLFLANTGICFEKAEGSGLNLTGKSKGKVERTQIINPDWDFSKMGIGGLDTQFNAIFRSEVRLKRYLARYCEQIFKILTVYTFKTV